MPTYTYKSAFRARNAQRRYAPRRRLGKYVDFNMSGNRIAFASPMAYSPMPVSVGRGRASAGSMNRRRLTSKFLLSETTS